MIRNDFAVHMGIDFGGKRIGIAFSDPTATLASAYEVYQSQGEERDINHLAELAASRQVKKVVFGIPFNADGSESEVMKRVEQFAQKFASQCKIEVDFEDERYSSLEAEEILKERGMDWKKRKQVLDMVAAEIILQNYLNKQKRG